MSSVDQLQRGKDRQGSPVAGKMPINHDPSEISDSES